MKNLHVEISGSGPQLLLLHGWGLNSAIWESIANELSHRYTVINIDLPGYGDSTTTQEEYSLNTLAKLLADIIDDQAIVMGWSLGGLIAKQLAIEFSNKVKALILVATSPYFVAQQNWYGIEPAVLSMFTEQLLENSHKTVERFLAIQAMGSESSRQDIKQLKNSLKNKPNPCPKALKAGLQLLQQSDLRSQLKSITHPKLCLYGSLDALVPAKAIPLIEQLYQQCETTVIDKASHAPFISHREEFLEQINKFVDKIQH